MQLSRDAIQRMFEGGSGGNVGGSSFDPSMLSGIATEAWVDANYVSIKYFNRLFQARNGDTAVAPNDISTTIDNIKATVGFWTDQYLSALGLGSSGGGGGGANALTELVDVNISSPQNGEALVYNATQQKWVNGAVGAVTSITAGTGLSGGTITSSGTIAISSTYQTYISHGETAYGWGDHAQAGYLTANDISDMATKTWVGNQGYLTSESNLNASNINSGTIGFSYLPTLYWANVAVSNQSSNTTEPQFAHVRLRSGSDYYGSYLRFGDGNYCYLYEDTDDHLKIYGSKGVEITTGSRYNLTWNSKTVATQEWVNSNYLSIAFFRSLFKAYNGSSVEIVPNSGDTSTIDNIKAMFGFWTNQYLSALGQNSSGGGGGSLSLDDLLDVDITSPSSGQVLKYNGTKWVNAAESGGGGTTLNQPLSAINNAGLGTPTQSGVAIMWNGSAWTYQVPGGGSGGGGTVTSVGLSVPTGFSVSGSPVTGSGTLTLSYSSGYSLPKTADVTKGVTAYGWGDHANAGYLTSSDLTGYATETWVNNNYLSISFFRSLFKAYRANGTTEVVPNSGSTSYIDSIKAMFGFWTDQYISALGQGSGSGSATALTDLVDVNISSPQNGDALLYNSSTGKWVNGTVGGGGGGGGSVTSVGLSAPTGFTVSGSPVTSSGTLTLGFASGYRLLDSEDETIITYGYTAYGWGNHADAGYATQTWVTNKHYLTSITSSMVTTALGFTPLSNATTFWGRTVSNGAVSGNINMSSGDKIINDSKTLLEYDGTQVTLAYGFRTTCPTQIHGTNVIFYASGTEKARVTSTGLQIGSAVLAWDSSNNALKVQKSDGTACNLYALGGVSALGFQAGTGGTDSATISDLTSELVTLTFLGSNDCTLENDAGNLILDTDGNSGYVKVCDLCSIDGDQFWEIRKSGIAIFSERVRSPRFYLDGTRYIYLDGTTLKYYNGTTSKTIVLS